MSFSAKIKYELASGIDAPRHCDLAEVAAFLSNLGQSGTGVMLSTDNCLLAGRFCRLARGAFGVAPEISYLTAIPGRLSKRRMFCCTLSAATGDLHSDSLLARECCKRAYIRGAFLTGGSTGNPSRPHHLEFVNHNKTAASLLQETIQHFDIDIRVTTRKSAFVLYIKDGERIAGLLNIMGAHKSLMELENARIIKEINNNVNRQNNFDTANIAKTVAAGVSQEIDIRYILERGMFDWLSKNLAEVARLRLDFPEASLKEIGDMLSPAISKSAVNHRLRKISVIAKELRGDLE